MAKFAKRTIVIRTRINGGTFDALNDTMKTALELAAEDIFDAIQDFLDNELPKRVPIPGEFKSISYEPKD